MKTITLTFIVPEDALCPECSRTLDVQAKDFIEAYLNIQCSGCGEVVSLVSESIDCQIQ